MSEPEDHEVGYKKPPKATQWKPGYSGNPKGRPKKTKDFERLLDQELSQPIRITDGEQVLSMTKREVLIKSIVNAALKGDRSSQKIVFSFMKTQLAIEAFEPDATDREALLALFEQAKLEDTEQKEQSNG
jgi:uncharacterized protein DUF5681